MRRFNTASRILPLVVLGLLVACGSADSDADAPILPAPTDPMVYDASAETTREVGIAKWGSADDGNTFRGYGRRNELLVEIKQTITEVDDFKRTFELVMTGPALPAPAVDKVDVEATWTSDNETMEYVSTTRENTFAEGSVAAKILAHVGPDAAAMFAASVKPGAGSLTTKGIHPMGGPDSGLVAPGEEPLLQCCADLTAEAVAMSAVPGGDCALVTSTGIPVVTGTAPKAIVLGADGKPTVQSPWAGKYNIVDHHCHNAASQNSSKTDGYIGCHPTSSTTSTQGHTISWGPDPRAKAGVKDEFCAYEPQSNKGTIASKSVCCWKGNAGTDGTPLIENAASKACVTQLCLGQAKFGDATQSAPKAFPAGSQPKIPTDCPGSTDSNAACGACCTKQADEVAGLFASDDKGKKKWSADIEGYRKRCSGACLEREIARQIKSAADKCAKAIGDALQSKASAKTSCSSNPSTGTSAPKK